jgi:hypothetical protein
VYILTARKSESSASPSPFFRRSLSTYYFHLKSKPRIRTEIFLKGPSAMTQGNAYNELLFRYVNAISTSITLPVMLTRLGDTV